MPTVVAGSLGVSAALCHSAVLRVRTSSELYLGPTHPGWGLYPASSPVLCSTPAGPQGAVMPSRPAQPLQRETQRQVSSFPCREGAAPALPPYSQVLWVVDGGPVWGRQWWLSRTPVVPQPCHGTGPSGLELCSLTLWHVNELLCTETLSSALAPAQEPVGTTTLCCPCSTALWHEPAHAPSLRSKAGAHCHSPLPEPPPLPL